MSQEYLGNSIKSLERENRLKRIKKANFKLKKIKIDKINLKKEKKEN